MKARKLRRLLNNTDYTIQQDGEKICIGGAYCNDIISVNMETLKMGFPLMILRLGSGIIPMGIWL